MRRRNALAGLLPVAPGLASAQPPARELGTDRRPYGTRAPAERSERFFAPSATPGTGASCTPLQDTFGILTPSDLHFERHHSGVPALDAATHEVMVHGLTRWPVALSIADLRRLPSVSRFHFIECAGNSGREHAGNRGETAQKSHGLVSCSEWTGVPLGILLERAGVQPGETYALTAYVLHLSGIVEQAAVLDDRSLPRIRMPNRDGFVADPRPDFAAKLRPR